MAAKLFLNYLVTDIENANIEKSKQWAYIQTTRQVMQGQASQRTQNKINGCENISKKETHDVSRKQI